MTAEPVSAHAAPLPGRPAIRQAWRQAVFLHWRVDSALVAPLLPAGVRPDEFDGSTWVGLIPFVLERTAFPPLPVIPWLGTFIEINVRLYSVDDRGRRGVVFRTLEAQHLLPVIAANAGIGLPYRWARMRSGRRDDRIAYSSTRIIGAQHPSTRVRARITDRSADGDPLATFLTARWGMHVGRRHGVDYWRNEHEPWRLFHAEVESLDDELVASSGLPGVATRPPDSVLFSPGVQTRFALPVRERP